MRDLSRFVSHADQEATCTVCGKTFHRPARSQIQVCGEVCRKARQRARAAASRAKGEAMRAEMLDRFGGKWPTADELVTLMKARRGTIQ